MFPGKQHSVSLFWTNGAQGRSFRRYFVNMEEPFRRTQIGFDTQDHTLDMVVQPDLTWAWRDEAELDHHVREGFFTRALAEAIRAEGLRVIDEIVTGVHPCVSGWSSWSPEQRWDTPAVAEGWDTAAVSFWKERSWAYGATANVSARA